MEYAFVEDDLVKYTRSSLPKNFGNVSGFNLLTLEELKIYGFYPYEYTSPTFDPMTEKLGEMEFEIGEDLVLGTRAVVALSAEELAQIKNNYITRNNALMLEFMYDTDWVFLEDADLTLEQKEKYEQIRANLLLVKADLENLEISQLVSLLQKLSDCKKCMCSRLKNFSSKMEALELELENLLSE